MEFFWALGWMWIWLSKLVNLFFEFRTFVFVVCVCVCLSKKNDLIDISTWLGHKFRRKSSFYLKNNNKLNLTDFINPVTI